MSKETAPSYESSLPAGEFTASRQGWTYISTQCETILGGVDGIKISQRTWEPDAQPDALKKLGISYGLTLTLARIGQTEPTPDTKYELTFTGRNYKGTFLFEPYLDEPVGILNGCQPALVAPEFMPEARRDMLIDYLSTYLGEDNG